MEILEGQTTFVGHDVTQLGACEEYCRREGYEILERFTRKEKARSTDCSQLQNLLTYCRLNKGRVHFVVVFN